jgi:GT2 family glycosyltransferase
MGSWIRNGQGGYDLSAKVTVVLLIWNEWHHTLACLSSLQQLDYPTFDVVVIDNGSTDDSAVRIRETFPWVKLIENGKNLGFSGGCNVGIKYAQQQGSDFIWLLNNDTTVDPGALRAMVKKAQSDPRIGAVGSLIYFMDEPTRLQCWGGGYVSFWLGRSGHFLKEVEDDKVEFITGCSLLLSRAAINEVGPLDEGFFMYWEDADICFRLRRAGWLLVVAVNSKLWHKGYTSIGKGKVSSYGNFNASAARFFRKHAPAPLYSVWVGFALRLGKRIVAGDRERLRATWNGMKQGRLMPRPVASYGGKSVPHQRQ